MLTVRAVLYSVILVIISNNCDTLQHEYNDVVDNALINGDSLVPDTDLDAKLETVDVIHVSFIENPNDDLQESDEIKVDTDLERNDILDSIDDGDFSDEEIKRRVARQAYSGHSPLYPNLALSSPYNQFQPYSNYPSYNYTTNPYNQPANVNPAFGQNSSYGNNNNIHHQGYPNYNNGNFSRPGQYNSSYSGYYPQPAHFNSSTGFYPGTPYNSHGNYSNSGHPVLYNNSAHVPGYNPLGPTSRPHNVTYFNNPSGRPPYNTSVNSYPYSSHSHNNNTPYNGQYYTTPRPWFGQNVPNSNSSSGQSPYQTPNNQFPNSNPYNNPYPYGGRPGQNNSNLNQWSQNTTYSNNPSDRNPYKPPNGQNSQNNYPTPSPYGGGNNNQRPYGNPSNGYNNNQYNPSDSGSGNQGPYGNPSNGYSNNQYNPSHSGSGNQGPYGNPSNGYNNNQYNPSHSGSGNQGPYGNPSNGYNNNQYNPSHSGSGNQGPYGNPTNGLNNGQNNQYNNPGYPHFQLS